jgi:hypothetical protein
MKWHLRFTPIVGVLFLVSATFSNAVVPDKAGKEAQEAKTPNYYPMRVGNQWNYRVEVGGNSAESISKIAKIETIDDVPLARLEAYIGGELKATEHLRQTDKGIFRYRNNGQEISPPICLLKYPVKSGATWDGEISVGKETGKYFCEATEESIEVAAGKFKTIHVSVRLESGGKTVHTSYWFVKNVGFVRQTVDAGNLNIVMELEKFEPAKEKEKRQ